ncbi:MAG TPA: hypothetical protein VG488_04290 [Candidatus Angelobacter sp.]|jgi:hypothetical protein|nr:hypothetical protein [Candidatus Angelobacter sp.]
MNINETIVVVVLVLAAVIVVALSRFKRVRARGQSKGIGEFEIHAEGKVIAPAQLTPQPGLPKKRTRKMQGVQPWFSSHWRALVIWSSIVLIIVGLFGGGLRNRRRGGCCSLTSSMRCSGCSGIAPKSRSISPVAKRPRPGDTHGGDAS